jgi:CRISPR system Cascade subunit CasE
MPVSAKFTFYPSASLISQEPEVSLYMIRLDPDVARATRWATAERLGRDEDYVWHALLKSAFGENAPKPFRVLERPGRPAQLLGYTKADRDTLLNHAQTFADPAVVEALRLDTLAVKQMPVQFLKGTRFNFEVRVRPVARQDRDGDRSKTRERDAFLVAIDKAGKEVSVERSMVYSDWLRSQLGRSGASLVSIRPLSLSRQRITRRDRERRLIEIDGPDAVFTGTLIVEDPAVFERLLARGVGRHRSFGYGMLLLSPPRAG